MLQKTKNMDYKSEADLQSKSNIWFEHTFPEQCGVAPRLFLIYNNAPNAVVASLLKSMGLKRGISDMVYFVPGNRKRAWIEFKLRGKKQSEYQERFEILVRLWGDDYWVIYDEFQFKEMIYSYNATRT